MQLEKQYIWLEIANELARVLKVAAVCTCRYNVPYENSYVKRVVIKKCSRCIALENWEESWP